MFSAIPFDHANGFMFSGEKSKKLQDIRSSQITGYWMRKININIICMHDKPILLFCEFIHDIKVNQIRTDIILNLVIGYHEILLQF